MKDKKKNAKEALFCFVRDFNKSKREEFKDELNLLIHEINQHNINIWDEIDTGRNLFDLLLEYNRYQIYDFLTHESYIKNIPTKGLEILLNSITVFYNKNLKDKESDSLYAKIKFIIFISDEAIIQLKDQCPDFVKLLTKNFSDHINVIAYVIKNNKQALLKTILKFDPKLDQQDAINCNSEKGGWYAVDYAIDEYANRGNAESLQTLLTFFDQNPQTMYGILLQKYQNYEYKGIHIYLENFWKCLEKFPKLAAIANTRGQSLICTILWHNRINQFTKLINLSKEYIIKALQTKIANKQFDFKKFNNQLRENVICKLEKKDEIEKCLKQLKELLEEKQVVLDLNNNNDNREKDAKNCDELNVELVPEDFELTAVITPSYIVSEQPRPTSIEQQKTAASIDISEVESKWIPPKRWVDFMFAAKFDNKTRENIESYSVEFINSKKPLHYFFISLKKQHVLNPNNMKLFRDYFYLDAVLLELDFADEEYDHAFVVKVFKEHYPNYFSEYIEPNEDEDKENLRLVLEKLFYSEDTPISKGDEFRCVRINQEIPNFFESDVNAANIMEETLRSEQSASKKRRSNKGKSKKGENNNNKKIKEQRKKEPITEEEFSFLKDDSIIERCRGFVAAPQKDCSFTFSFASHEDAKKFYTIIQKLPKVISTTIENITFDEDSSKVSIKNKHAEGSAFTICKEILEVVGAKNITTQEKLGTSKKSKRKPEEITKKEETSSEDEKEEKKHKKNQHVPSYESDETEPDSEKDPEKVSQDEDDLPLTQFISQSYNMHSIFAVKNTKENTTNLQRKTTTVVDPTTVIETTTTKSIEQNEEAVGIQPGEKHSSSSAFQMTMQAANLMKSQEAKLKEKEEQLKKLQQELDETKQRHIEELNRKDQKIAELEAKVKHLETKQPEIDFLDLNDSNPTSSMSF